MHYTFKFQDKYITVTPEDIDNANIHLHVASTELLNNYDKEGKKIGFKDGLEALYKLFMYKIFSFRDYKSY